MGVLGKMKDWITGADIADEEDESMGEFAPFRRAVKKEPDEDYDAPVVRKNNKVFNINATMPLGIVLVQPERFEEAASIADHINTRHAVILNLEVASKEISRRLVDFLSGVAYANGGQITRVAANTFVIAPDNVNVMGELLGALENNGIFF